MEDAHKIIFCSIPKVASTTWKRVLADLQGLKQGIYVHQARLWRRLGEYSEEGQSHRLKNYFKFMFVREPLHRILSAYKDKFIGKNRDFSKNIRKMIVNSLRSENSVEYGQDMKVFSRKPSFDKDNNVSFPEFIRYYSADIPRNPHWRQFKDLCHPCFIDYDVIGNLETLAEDATLVLKMAGIDDYVNFPPIHNATGSRDMEHYYSQVPHEDVVRLAELYRDDYKLFGYEFLGPVKHLLNQSSNIGVWVYHRINYTQFSIGKLYRSGQNSIDFFCDKSWYETELNFIFWLWLRDQSPIFIVVMIMIIKAVVFVVWGLLEIQLPMQHVHINIFWL